MSAATTQATMAAMTTAVFPMALKVFAALMSFPLPLSRLLVVRRGGQLRGVPRVGRGGGLALLLVAGGLRERHAEGVLAGLARGEGAEVDGGGAGERAEGARPHGGRRPGRRDREHEVRLRREAVDGVL